MARVAGIPGRRLFAAGILILPLQTFANEFNPPPFGDFADTPGGLTPTQASFAGVLDSACPALEDSAQGAQDDLLATCNALGGAAPDSIRQDLRVLAPDEVAVQGTAAVDAALVQGANIASRLAAIRRGSVGISLTGLSLTPTGNPDRDGLYFASLDDQVVASAAASSAADRASEPFGRLGIFLNGDVAFGDREGSINEPGFDFDTRGVTGGLDYRFSDHFVLGAAVGYVSTDSDLNDGSDVDVDGYSVSLFGTYYQSDTFYIDGVARYGRNDYDTSRSVVFGAADQTADSDSDGDEYAFSIDSGYNVNFEQLSIGPYAQVSYARAEIDGFEEQPSDPGAPGAGSLLAIDSQTVESLSTIVGGQAAYAISTSVGVFSPQLRIGYEHEFKNDSRLITGRFLNDPTNTDFAVPTDEPDRDFLNLAVGVSATLPRGIAGFLQYRTLFGHNEVDLNAFAGGLRYNF